jgi:hypothetical protein
VEALVADVAEGGGGLFGGVAADGAGGGVIHRFESSVRLQPDPP